MLANSSFSGIRSLLPTTALAGFLFLQPPALRAQDAKDAEIERLKKENAVLQDFVKWEITWRHP